MRKHPKWLPNPESKSNYQAMIGVPLHLENEVRGVLTIDALTPMGDEACLIGEVYAAVIEVTLMEYVMAIAEGQTS